MNFIKELSQKRKRWVESSKENNFEEGIKNLLTELYPDNAHFVYELLQNAEDARATKVKFVLNSKGLNFLHNGKKQFTEPDIESITSIGNSPKKDDFNQIGKFGVGFKAVFSYTQTPQIYSGKWSFEIQDLVCPKEIPQIPQILSGKSNSTFFWFPFNHPQKTKDKALQEIEKTLVNLPDNTILFLRHIEEISWEIEQEKKETGYIKITKLQNENLFEIEKRTDKSQKSFWLRFTKTVPEKEGLFVAIAFRLEKIKDLEEFKIDNNVAKGDVSIFFPAEKEISGLKFFIHAPFSATVARDSIQNKPENEELRDFLVELLVESISKIKDFGILNSNFLEILPNKKDELTEFYEPFRDQTLDLFKNQSFTPTISNNFLPAKKLIQANNEIKRTISKKTILNFLVENEDVDWSINAQRGSRLFDFLESLEINEWGWKDLLYKIGDKFKQKEVASEALSSQPDEWMQQFYILLGKAKEEVRYFPWDFPKIEKTYIVRLEDKNHSLGENVYFQTEFIKKAKNVSIVKPEIYQSNKDSNQNEKSKLFLKTIGVKDFEQSDEIKIVLDKYYEDDAAKFLKISSEENLKHLKKFIKFLKENPNESDIFSDYYILRTENEDKTTDYYSTPPNVFIDEPFEKTLLSFVKPMINKNKLWDGYFTQIKNQEDFIFFLKKIGVVTKLIIERTTIWGNPSQTELKQDIVRFGARETDYCINRDYKISDLEKMLSEKNLKISQLIWETMCKTDSKVLQAQYRPNSNYSTKFAPSQLVYKLKQFAWIPDKKGIFHKPEDITREVLLDDFPFDNRNSWLDAIGVGTQAQKNKIEEQQKIEKAAKQLGFESLEEAERAKEWAKMSKEERAEFEEFKQQKAKDKKMALPNSIESETENIYYDTEIDSDYNEYTDEEVFEEDVESDFSDEIVNFFESLSRNNENNGKNQQKLRKEIEKKVNEERKKTRNLNVSEVEKEQIVKSRVGQFIFRENVEQIENKCRLTDLEDKRFLIASHIKPWSNCDSDEEKIDGSNGFLLSPHVDKLFDKGLISFDDEGKILCANDEIEEIMKIWGLDKDKNVGTFNEKQKEYLAYHRKENGFER